jgi:hypothetical protein
MAGIGQSGSVAAAGVLETTGPSARAAVVQHALLKKAIAMARAADRGNPPTLASRSKTDRYTGGLSFFD